MGEMMIITETGMFHSAVRVTIGGSTTWYGFKPRKHGSPAGPGFVDNSDRSTEQKYWAKWDIDDVVLQAAADKESRAYATAYYAVGFKDCVSFTANLARDCGMRVPEINSSPYGFLKVLEFWNPPKASGRSTSSFWTW